MGRMSTNNSRYLNKLRCVICTIWQSSSDIGAMMGDFEGCDDEGDFEKNDGATARHMNYSNVRD